MNHFVLLALANYTFFPSFGQFVYTKKIPHLSRQTTYQAIFGRLRKNRSAQRARGPSTKTDDSQKVPGLVSKRDGVAHFPVECLQVVLDHC